MQVLDPISENQNVYSDDNNVRQDGNCNGTSDGENIVEEPEAASPNETTNVEQHNSIASPIRRRPRTRGAIESEEQPQTSTQTQSAEPPTLRRSTRRRAT